VARTASLLSPGLPGLPCIEAPISFPAEIWDWSCGLFLLLFAPPFFGTFSCPVPSSNVPDALLLFLSLKHSLSFATDSSHLWSHSEEVSALPSSPEVYYEIVGWILDLKKENKIAMKVILRTTGKFWIFIEYLNNIIVSISLYSFLGYKILLRCFFSLAFPSEN
jgi:hypothetical protein